MPQHVLTEQHSAQGRTVAHGAGRELRQTGRQAVAAAPAEAGLDTGKDRAARRRESADSGGAARTFVSAAVIWHAAKDCCCRAALNRSDEEHLNGEGEVRCPHILHTLHVLTSDIQSDKAVCTNSLAEESSVINRGEGGR